jgi:hypothetical protein
MTSQVVGWLGPLLVLVLHGRAKHETSPWARAWAVNAACGPARHDTVERHAGPGRARSLTRPCHARARAGPSGPNGHLYL